MTTPNHLTEGEIAGYLDQNLDHTTRAGVERHLEDCPDCRAELIAVMKLAADPAAPTASAPRSRKRWFVPAAIAAGLAVIAFGTSRSGKAPVETERPASGLSESLPRLAVTGPMNGASVTRDSLLFGWRSRPGESYRVTILSESGEPVWSVETVDTAVSVPNAVSLAAGRLYFWRVDAVADGRSASSGIQQFRVTP